MGHQTQSEEYKELLANPDQPKRSIEATKVIAEDELRRLGYSGKLKIVMSSAFRNPETSAAFLPAANQIRMHPISRFADEEWVRETVRHEAQHYKDTTHGVHRALGKYCEPGEALGRYFCNRCKEWHFKGDKKFLRHLRLQPL